MRKNIHDLIADALKKQSESEPLAKQLLLDEKIREALESIKEFNKNELKRIETKKHIFWRMLAITSVVLNFVLLLASPVEIGHVVAEKVRENVVEPDVRQALDRIVQQNASGYIDGQLGPFKKDVDDLHAQIVGLKTTIMDAESISAKAQAVTETLQKQSSGVNDQLNSVNAALNLTGLVIRADNDDRKAFDQLVDIANSNNQFSAMAGEVIIGIVGKSELQVVTSFPWQALGTSDPEKLTFEGVKQIYAQQVRPDFKKGLIVYIWGNQKIAKVDRLDFLISVIKDDQSITAVTAAIQQVDGESQIKHNLLDAKAYLDWWASKRATYVSQASNTAVSTNSASAPH